MKTKEDWDKEMIKKTLPLIWELKDKYNEIHRLGASEDKNQTFDPGGHS